MFLVGTLRREQRLLFAHTSLYIIGLGVLAVLAVLHKCKCATQTVESPERKDWEENGKEGRDRTSDTEHTVQDREEGGRGWV